jgi:hypothetical protein
LRAQARAEGRFDTGLAPVRLQLLAPAMNRVDIDEARFVVRISAASRFGGAGLPITVHDRSGATLANGTTNASGQLERTIATTSLSPPGPHALVVRSAGDATRGAAQLEQTVIGYLRTNLSLQAEASDEQVVLLGTLFTARGPQPRKAVGLFVEGQHLATVLTDERGRFSHTVKASPTAPPEARSEQRAQARFDSDAAWLASSRSATVTVRWEVAAIAASPAWLLASSALCAALLLWWSARRPRALPQKVPPPVRGPGIHALGSRARGRSFDGVAGVVLDARNALPLRGALVLLEGPDGARLELATQDDGGFAASALHAGQWRMTADAEGFAPQSQELTLPHHGSWAYVQVLLQRRPRQLLDVVAHIDRGLDGPLGGFVDAEPVVESRHELELAVFEAQIGDDERPDDAAKRALLFLGHGSEPRRWWFAPRVVARSTVLLHHGPLARRAGAKGERP